MRLGRPKKPRDGLTLLFLHRQQHTTPLLFLCVDTSYNLGFFKIIPFFSYIWRRNTLCVVRPFKMRLTHVSITLAEVLHVCSGGCVGVQQTTAVGCPIPQASRATPTQYCTKNIPFQRSKFVDISLKL